MAFSDAFLRGRAISQQDKDEKLAGVRAILARSGSRSRAGSAIRPTVVGGGGGALSRVNQASARVAAEERQEEADQMAREKHTAIMEQADLSNEMLRREIAKMPSEEEALRSRHDTETQEAYDRAIAAQLAVGQTSLAEGAIRDSMDVQLRNRARRSLHDALTMRNADAANKAIRGVFPGMESYMRVEREYRPEERGITGPALREGATGYRETMTEEATGSGYPVFSNDGEGNLYVQWPGSESSVPVTDGDIRQLMYASAPGLEAPVSGKKAATATGLAAGEKKDVSGLSPDEKADYIIKQQKANNDTFKTAIDFANSMHPEGDALTGGEARDPQQWLQSFMKGVDLMGTKTVQEQTRGLQPTRPPMKRRINDKFVQGLVSRLEDEIEGGRIPETERMQRVKEIADTLSHNFGWEAEKKWLLANSHWGIPEALNAMSPGNDPNNVPDLGTGTDNVMHYKDDKVGMVIDKKLGHAKFWNKDTERWEAASKSLLQSFRDILRVKVKIDGQESLAPMLAEIDKKLKGLSGTFDQGRRLDWQDQGLESPTSQEELLGIDESVMVRPRGTSGGGGATGQIGGSPIASTLVGAPRG